MFNQNNIIVFYINNSKHIHCTESFICVCYQNGLSKAENDLNTSVSCVK